MKALETATAVAVLAAMAVSPAWSAAPVCGDVNQTSSVTSADALLVLRKSVSQPVALSCAAYDEQYSQCQAALASCEGGGVCGNGSAATTFLAKLNGNADDVCFAGHCDWRLPTIDELETIFEPEPGCGTPPCPADEVFLPMSTSAHWSSTSETPYNVYYAWGVVPDTGKRGGYYKRQEHAVRAVRSAE